MINPFSTGQGGAYFETSVQTTFVLNMIVNGRIPYLPEGKVEWIKLQGRVDDFQTDDFILSLTYQNSEFKLLAQIKRDISINSSTEEFNKVIKEFWTDYNNTNIFDKANDIIVLIKGGLLRSDKNIKTVLDWAKTTIDEEEFVKKLDIGKTKIYEHFKNSLNLANNGIILSEKQIWQFLKKIYILSYDFDFAEQSQNQVEVLNLIRLAKNHYTSAIENEIWSTIHEFVEKRNFTGSKITERILQEKGLLNYFDIANLVSTRKAIFKLKNDTEISFKSISDKIGDKKHLERTNLSAEFKEVLFQSNFTIITGEPGVGKTAFAKNILKAISGNETNIIAFNAVQFNKPQIAETLSSVGISESIQDIFADYSLFPSRIIFVDDIHKLLGVEHDHAFRELLTLIKEKNIYFIATCRTYAYEKIILKYSNWLNNGLLFNVPPLSQDEINQVVDTFPQLKSLFKNKRLSELLLIPKYLDYAIKSEIPVYSNDITISDFKNTIWEKIIKGQEESHIQKHRSRLFSRISVERAKTLSIFIYVDDNDLIIAEKLKEENVLTDNNDKYAPAHDMLEDIALERFINEKYIDNKFDILNFFTQIGSEPAIYRAFYLWCLLMLEENNNEFDVFVLNIIQNSEIELFWKDELMHAILETEFSSLFFETNKELVLENEGLIFQRFLKVLNATCREYDSRYERNGHFNPHAFLPKGIGWTVISNFVADNYQDIHLSHEQIITLFENWHQTIYNISEHEVLARKIGKVTFGFLQDLQNSYGRDNVLKSNLKLILNLSTFFEVEIKNLFKDTIEHFKNRREKQKYKTNVYETFSEIVLSGDESFLVCLFFPKLVCSLVKVAWQDPREEIKHFGEFVLPNHERRRNFGLKAHFHNDHPASALKTPLSNLLYFHHKIALTFIVELVNYSTDIFYNSDFNKEDERFELEIDLLSHGIVKQKAALTLWCLYRGTYVATPYILQSVLMSLEKWLLGIAKNEEIEKLNYTFDFLIKNSYSVATTSILISVATAYPIAFGEKIFSLLKIKEFYVLDNNRKFQEHQALAPVDFENPCVQEERCKSNQLPLRKKSIDDLVRDLTFTIYRNDIYSLIDKFKIDAAKNDASWIKTLHEIDFRNWEIKKQVENGFEVAPTTYPPEVIKWQDESKGKNDHIITKMSLFTWTSKVLEDESIDENTFEKWNSFYEAKEKLISNCSEEVKLFMSEKEMINSKLVSLAAIGVRDYYDKLSLMQKEWCYNQVLKSIQAVLMFRFQQYSHKSSEAAIVLPFILQKANKKEKNEIKKLIIATLTIADEQTKKHSIKGIKKYLWKIDEQFAETCVKAILEYNKLNNELSINFRMLYSNEKDKHYKIIHEKQLKFIDTVEKRVRKFDINKIAFDEQAKFGVIHALNAIPSNTQNKFSYQLYTTVLDLIFILKTRLKKDKWNEDRVNYHFYLDFQQLLANFLLGQNIDNAETILIKLISGIEIGKKKYDEVTNKHEISDYLKNIHETIEKTLFFMQANSSRDFGEANFWYLWEVISNEFKRLNIYEGVKVKNLLFDLKYENENWLDFTKKKDFIKNLITDFGHSETGFYASIQLLTGTGKMFSPESIEWIGQHLSKDKDDKLLQYKNTIYYMEKYIRYLIECYLPNIRNNSNYRKVIFIMLDKMFNAGSITAHKLREQIIIN